MPLRGPHRGLRTRIGPLKLLGSMTCPPWVISARPIATRRRAAIRAGSISSDQSSEPTARAASDGHTEALGDRPSSKDSKEASSWRSTSPMPCFRQLSEHQRTESQSRAQTLRQVMVRPHRAHGLDGRAGRAIPEVCPGDVNQCSRTSSRRREGAPRTALRTGRLDCLCVRSSRTVRSVQGWRDWSASTSRRSVNLTTRPERVGRAAHESHAERPGRQGCDAHEPPGFVAASSPDRECVAGATCPYDDGLARPLGHGGDRPVRDTPRDDCSELQDAVGQLDAGLDPLLRVGTDQQARLVELGREVSDEPDLSGRPVGEVGEQGVAGVVDEPVGGGSPQVAALRCGDQQVVLVAGDLRRWVQPVTVPPARTPPVSRSSVGHGIILPRLRIRVVAIGAQPIRACRRTCSPVRI